MTAYCVVRVHVTDPERYEDYKKLSPGAVAAYGGKFLVRGGATETVEGEDESRRVVIVEFPDLEAARAFASSPEYGEAREVRSGAADVQMVLVDGV
ncbi:MAG: DUF1330 domain-containing protein [Acidimicrobiales bacterium]